MSAGWQAYGASDVGLARQRNEDAFGMDEAAGCYLVADGLGGHAGGDVASATARDTVLDRVRAAATEIAAEPGRTLAEAVGGANAAIARRARDDPALAGMGTTLSILWLGGARGRQGCIAHVGDSRIYRLEAAGLRQLTEDHTYAMELVHAGAMTLREAEESFAWHQLTRAVGLEPDVAADVFAVETTEAEGFLLCSDGLTGMVGDGEIERLLRAHAGAPKAACEALINAAVYAGGDDNVTVVVLYPTHG